jgi:hypothetical protein
LWMLIACFMDRFSLPAICSRYFCSIIGFLEGRENRSFADEENLVFIQEKRYKD